MPIHDQGYRRYAGRRQPHGSTWQVIARAVVMEPLRKRWFLSLLLLAWLPFFGRGVQIYFSLYIPQATLLAVTPETFREFMDFQNLFVFFITIATGAGLIANDRRANALQIYLSKPLTRADYVVGKLAGLSTFLAAVTFLPGILLLVLQMLFSGSITFVRENLFLIPAITVYSATQVALSAFVMLALSSLSKSRRFVAVMYAGIVFFTAAMYQVLRQLTGAGAWALISPEDVLDVLAGAIFRAAETPPIPVPFALLTVLVLIGGSIWILDRRVRGVEVVT